MIFLKAKRNEFRSELLIQTIRGIFELYLKGGRQMDIARNKKNAIAFYDLMFNHGKPKEAIAQFVGDDRFIQHNPRIGDGKAAFIHFYNWLAKEHPHKRVEFKKVIGEGHFVVLHCLQHIPGDRDYAVIDIFRFDEEGKIAEHWDVQQEIPQTSENNNSMF
jgi:predicted SnoaL-like aldol condensation-catalyzing enzyme